MFCNQQVSRKLRLINTFNTIMNLYFHHLFLFLYKFLPRLIQYSFYYKLLFIWYFRINTSVVWGLKLVFFFVIQIIIFKHFTHRDRLDGTWVSVLGVIGMIPARN